MTRMIPSEGNSFRIETCYFLNKKGEENTHGEGQRKLFVMEHLRKITKKKKHCALPFLIICNVYLKMT